MQNEIRQFYDTLHPDFTYTDPEGKSTVDFSSAPEPTVDITNEMKWHMKNYAYRNVTRTDGSGWTKQAVLDAISKGCADAFTINQIRFPPTFQGTVMTEHYPILFDDRNFGERIANIALEGFGRETRQ